MLDLKNDKRFRYVLIFKNHGEAAGASLEHPHSQLIALPIVPRRVREEVDSSWHYYDEKERCISVTSSVRNAIPANASSVKTNISSRWPRTPRGSFEMWLLPKAHGSSYENNQSSMYASLARMLKGHAHALDVVLDRPAYNFMIHTSPIGEEINDHYHWHIEIIPKLTKWRALSGAPAFTSIPRRRKKLQRFLREAKCPSCAR